MSGLNIQRLRDIFDIVYDSANGVLKTSGSGGGGEASAANQTAVQAIAGADASKATAVQGIANGKPVAITSDQLSYTETQLTAAGQATTSRSKVGYPSISISYTVALNGSTSVTVRVQVSNDNTNWINADLAGVDTTQTTSGTFGFVGTNQYQFVRFLFVSEAGGTGATIDVVLSLGVGLDGGNGLVEVTASALPTGAAMASQLPPSLGLKTAPNSLSVIQADYETLPFTSVCFERNGTFVDTTNHQDLCEYLTNTQATFTQVTTADAMELVSSSASDAAAGTNSRTVGVIYLNASGVWSQTIVTLNGTTAVPLTGIQATAIISMSVLSGGSNPVSAGNITLRKVGTPTTIYEQITAGGNQSKSGRFTCPAGYYALIQDLHLSAANQATEFAGRSTRNQFDGSTTANDRYLFKDSILIASGSQSDFGVYDRIDAGQTYKISAIPANVNARVYGSFVVKVIKL